jgi:preprotein translocase subunit SecE
MTKIKAFEFIRQVKQEVVKITWPTRQEVTVTTVAVLIFVSIAALFFLCADFVLQYLVRKILSLGM